MNCESCKRPLKAEEVVHTSGRLFCLNCAALQGQTENTERIYKQWLDIAKVKGRYEQ